MRKREEEVFKPNNYMRSRRPYLFSDSIKKSSTPISKDQFEYHLETLTNRQEETPFERFGRDLIKRKICPNLIPHTGPMGGGDGKTDSENYRVSEEIAALWWIGKPKRSSKERFAFCFSAAKEWKTKFLKDIASALSTDRPFTAVYFMTNQFVSSKKRAKLQDTYSKKYDCDIRILDRNWILESVFDDELWDLVTKHFDIQIKLVKIDGPQDTKRKQQLEFIEKEIENSKYQGIEFADDCLTAAILASSLDLPRSRIDGLFERAERACENFKSKVQLFRVVYKRAWTSYFWFNDFDELSKLYDQAESYIIENPSAFLLQDLGNLCQIGLTETRSSKDGEIKSIWRERSNRLTNALKKIYSADPDSVNGLWAETQIYIRDFLIADDFTIAITEFCNRVSGILPKASHYAGYPVQVLGQIFNEFGEYIIDNEVFDDTFEKLMELESSRLAESTRGKSRLRRGHQLYKHEKWYQAIEQLAISQRLLAKEEQHDEFVASIFLTGMAYKNAGLFWAARANMISAISISIQNKRKFGHLIPVQVEQMIQEFAFTELHLGRILCALAAVELGWHVSSQENMSPNISNSYRNIDIVMARLIIESSISELSQLSSLPNIIDQFCMLSSSTLLFCLGHEDLAAHRLKLAEFEPVAKKIVTETNMIKDREFLPEWYSGSEYRLKSKLLGCVIEIIADDLNGILIAESLLAYLEHLLATAVLLNQCMATRPLVRVRVNKKASSEFKVTEEDTDTGEIEILVDYSFDNIRDFADPPYYTEKLFRTAVSVMEKMNLMIDEKALKDLFEKHEALTRAQFGASSLTSILKLFGIEPKYLVESWISGNQDIQDFSLNRTERWIGQLVDLDTNSSNADKEPLLFQDSPDIESLKQSELSIQSPINWKVWKKAEWNGIAFGTTANDPSYAEAWLTFSNVEAGRKIFRGWRSKVGSVDTEEWLGIWIVTGINKLNPSWYRVVISVNESYLENLNQSIGRMVLSPTFIDMTPQTDENLQRFLKAYGNGGSYTLGPAKGVMGRGIEVDSSLTIRKSSLIVIPAWQIEDSSMLCMTLHGLENPVIPEGENGAPIFEALKKYKKILNS